MIHHFNQCLLGIHQFEIDHDFFLRLQAQITMDEEPFPSSVTSSSQRNPPQESMLAIHWLDPSRFQYQAPYVGRTY